MDLSLIAAFAFGFGYIAVGGVALGAAVGRLLSDREGRAGSILPSWELAHSILFVLAWSSIWQAGDNGSTLALGLRPIWVLALLLFAGRLALVGLIYWQVLGSRAASWLLAAVSLAIPAVLSQQVVVLLAGENDVRSHAGVGLALALGAVALVIALWGGHSYRPGRMSREAARTGYGLALAAMLVLLPLALYFDAGIRGERSVFAAGWPLALAPVLGIGVLMQEWRQRYFTASIVLLCGLAATAWILVG